MEWKALHRHGWTVSALAREFGVCRDTVRRELRRDGPAQYARDKPTELTPAQLAHVERRLAGCASIRGTDLHHELAERYSFTGSYASFQRQLRLLRPAVVREPEIRFETDPGHQAQTDWGHVGVWPVDGEPRELFALVTILGYSRRPAVRFALDRTRTTTLTRLALTLDDLGGATKQVLSDRDPAFVIGSTSDGRAIFAPEWIDWAEVLGVVPKACRPYRPKTKGKVERMVREVKESFLVWLTGRALPPVVGVADYDALAAQWIHERVLPRRHRTTGLVVAAAWEAEVPLLTPLPRHVIAAATAHTTTVQRPVVVVDITQRLAGEHVQVRDLAEYEVAQ
jgi:transposase